jgi:hypothetical protein
MSPEVAFMKSQHKPSMPSPKVIHPDNLYDRKDKGWENEDPDDVDGEEGDEYIPWSERPYV